MIIRNSNIEDASTLSEIHIQAFKGFFLTELGHSFLTTYYRSVVRTKGSISKCAVEDNGEIVGFATGAYCSSGYNRRLILNNRWSFLLQAFVLLFTRTKALVRIILNFQKSSNQLDDGDYSELLSIAVLPKTRGTGIGKSLLESFTEEVHKQGGERITLTTDFYDNDSVIEFYTKNGFKIFYDFVAYPHRRMYKMIKYLK